MQSPETRPSLILRLHDRQDVRAWSEFAEIYEPLVYRLARRMGMQDADALEAKQEVMLHLANVVESWQPSDGGSFRGWLYRVARNVMLRQLERRGPVNGTGDSREHVRLGQVEASRDTPTEFDIEFQRQVFAWAAQRVRTEVEASTWQAFWETFVEEKDVATVAEQLGISPGNVYVARSRVMKRLREAVRRQIDREWTDIELVPLPPSERTSQETNR